MTRKPVRTKVAAATTALGVAVLLAGPMNTFGLGVPSTGDVAGTTTQVTSTVQGAVDTTQQTAATTVTNVESTVQTTVQTTTQAVAPQPTATAPARPSAPSAAKQVTSRATAPATKQVSAVSRPRTQGKPASAPAQQLAKAGGASSERVSVAEVAKRTHVARTRHVTAAALTTTSSSGAQDAPVDCNVPALAMLPGGAQLQALLSVVCDAAGGLNLPARIGLVDSGTSTPVLGEVRGASPRGNGDPIVARLSSLGRHPTAAGGARQATGDASGALAAGQPGSAPLGVGAGRGASLAYLSSVPSAHISPASGPAAGVHGAAGASGHHHHSFFSGQSRGTEILLAIIFASLSVLGGIALWRLAVRFVIPRFA